jgi:hypothetical protein
MISRFAQLRHRSLPLASTGGYRMLARACWRRRKGGYSRRSLRRALIASYLLPGSPVLANTCCTSLMSAAATSTSSVPLPP